MRLRVDASVNADIINAYPAGTQFVITGAPVQAEEFTWYPVALVGDESVTGWVAANFLQQAEGGQ